MADNNETDKGQQLLDFIDARVEWHVAEIIGNALAPFDTWASNLSTLLKQLQDNDVTHDDNIRGIIKSLGETQNNLRAVIDYLQPRRPQAEAQTQTQTQTHTPSEKTAS